MEYLIVEETAFSQEAQAEQKDDKDRLLKTTRPARDEALITVRKDRQYTAKLRLPRTQVVGAKRHENITTALGRVSLGEEIAPGVRVVEYEQNLTEAREAIVIPEQKDKAGKLIAEESYTPPTPEIIEHWFTLRINGLHLTKKTLTDAEFRQSNWKELLSSGLTFEQWEG